MFQSAQALFAYIMAQVDSKGRKKAWDYGYISRNSDEDVFVMENEMDGETVTISIEDDSDKRDDYKRYSVYVTKRFIIRENENESPTHVDLVNTLVDHVCKLHGDIGLYTLFFSSRHELEK